MIFNPVSLGTTQTQTTEYVRPTEWLSLPTVSEGEDKLVGLFAVYNHDSNFVSIVAQGTTLTDGYTVEWGNGVVETFANNVQANYIYDSSTYSSLNSQTEFRNYKQVIITVTPTTPGQKFNTVSTNILHPSGTTLTKYSWLDISVAGSDINNAYIIAVQNRSYNTILEKFTFVGSNNITIFSYMFMNCNSLQSVSINTSNGSNFTGMFYQCFSLQTISLPNTSNGTIFTSMFSSSISLKTIPLIDTSSGTTFTSMFQGCYSLQTIPLLNTSNGTDFSNMFQFCRSLETIPLINTSNGTTFAGMFAYCITLQTIPLLNTSNGIFFSDMIRESYTLQTIPTLNVSKGTDFSNIIYLCSSLGKASLSGTSYNIYYSGCKLSKDEIVDIFNNLATVTSKTITVSGNWGYASLTASDRLIATSKGWTIV